MKLWGGRFNDEEDVELKKFDNSLPLGKRYYQEDIEGSIAHANMLGNCKVISVDDSRKIVEGLQELLEQINEDELEIPNDGFEDIHSFVETKLIEKIGDIGKKLHTARSRNDQVAVDTKMYCRKQGKIVLNLLEQLVNSLKEKGINNQTLMPGYTHLQRAQVVSFRYYMDAYVEMFLRDKQRIENTLFIMNESPLGAGALAGTTHKIDREYTAKKLGFKKPSNNFMDAVSDRDYVIELLSDFSIIMVHLSRLCEELVIWSTKEFSFIKMADSFSTGSSMMPQKKNPDGAELIRGCSGIVFGSLMSMLTVMKGLPLTYAKDMQLDKESFFPALDKVKECLKVTAKMLDSMTINKDIMLKAISGGYMNATDLADYLVKKGMPFRDAHYVVGEIVSECEKNSIDIIQLPLKKMQKFSTLIQEDVYDYIDEKNSLKKGIKIEME